MLALSLYLCSGPKCRITIMQRGIFNESAEDGTHTRIHCQFPCYYITFTVDMRQSSFISSVPLLMGENSCLLKFTTWQAEIRALSNSGFHCSSHHDHRYLNRLHKLKVMQLRSGKSRSLDMLQKWFYL